MSPKTSRQAIGTTWVVVADAARADIFQRATRRAPLELLQSFTEPDARAREHELATDSPGRTFDSLGATRHSKEPEHTGKQQLRLEFSRRIAEFIEAGRTANRFEHLALVAAPAFLGALRAALSPAAQNQLSNEVHKHMTGRDTGEIEALLDH